MRAFWSDPYLWVHLAGLAVVPVGLEVCLVGLAMGDPLLPSWLEIVLVAIAGIAPILWMQWQRPFSIYSLVAVVLTPSQLTDDQRRILKIFKSQESRILAAIAAFVLFLVLVKIYDLSPIATPVAPQLIGGRLTGLVLAAIAFLAVNLFVQVPVSVLRALAVSQSAFADTIPYPSEQVVRDFSLLGIGVKRILPPMVMEQPRPKPSPPVAVTNEPLVSQEDDLWDEPIASTAPLAESSLDDGVTATAVEAEDETALLDDPTITEDDAWEASESVEEIAEREGSDIDIAPVETAIAEPADAPEPEGVWETSVELPVVEEATAAAVDEAAIAKPTEASEPEGVWESSVDLPLGEATEHLEESALTHDGEEAIADLSEGASVTESAAASEMYIESMAAEEVPIAESELASPPDIVSTESVEESEQIAANASESEGLLDDTFVSLEPADDNLQGNAPEIDEPSTTPDALAFDELFDEAKAAEDSLTLESEEETPEIDSAGDDLPPKWDESRQSSPDNEQRG